MQFPVANGYDDAKRCTVDICQLPGGRAVQKSTDIWVSQIPAVVELLTNADGGQRFKCPGASPLHKHMPVRGDTSNSVAFKRSLVHLLATGVHKQYSGA